MFASVLRTHGRWLVLTLKVGSHCRSDKLDQARSSDREPVWQVVGVVGIDRVSYMIIFDCEKSRVAIE